MTTIPGSPPYSDALRNMMETNLRNISDEKFGAMIQAQATLALAYEQRTANLIAYWNALAGDAEPWADTPFQRELDDMHRDIRTRLGRTAEVPK